MLALSDLHTCAGEIEIWENNSRTARRVQRDVSQAIVAMEEFILVAGQRSGFLLSPAVAEAWRHNGCAKELSDDGRLLRLNINILDQRYDFVSGYAPSGDTRGRRDFFESASAFLSSARVFPLRRQPPDGSFCSGLRKVLCLIRWLTATLALDIGALGGSCGTSRAELQMGTGMSWIFSCVAL